MRAGITLFLIALLAIAAMLMMDNMDLAGRVGHLEESNHQMADRYSEQSDYLEQVYDDRDDFYNQAQEMRVQVTGLQSALDAERQARAADRVLVDQLALQVQELTDQLARAQQDLQVERATRQRDDDLLDQAQAYRQTITQAHREVLQQRDASLEQLAIVMAENQRLRAWAEPAYLETASALPNTGPARASVAQQVTLAMVLLPGLVAGALAALARPYNLSIRRPSIWFEEPYPTHSPAD